MNCFRQGCPVEVEPGIVFCPADWKRLPRHVRQFMLEEQRKAHRARSQPSKEWQVTAEEAIQYLHGLDLEESFARAKPLTLTAEKSLLGRLADQVLRKVKTAHDFVVVIHPIATEPVCDGERVFVPSVEALHELLLRGEAA